MKAQFVCLMPQDMNKWRVVYLAAGCLTPMSWIYPSPWMVTVATIEGLGWDPAILLHVIRPW